MGWCKKPTPRSVQARHSNKSLEGGCRDETFRNAEIQIATLNVERNTICFPSRPIAEHGIKSTTAVSVAVVMCIPHLLQNSRPVFVVVVFCLFYERSFIWLHLF